MIKRRSMLAPTLSDDVKSLAESLREAVPLRHQMKAICQEAEESMRSPSSTATALSRHSSIASQSSSNASFWRPLSRSGISKPKLSSQKFSTCPSAAGFRAAELDTSRSPPESARRAQLTPSDSSPEILAGRSSSNANIWRPLSRSGISKPKSSSQKFATCPSAAGVRASEIDFSGSPPASAKFSRRPPLAPSSSSPEILACSPPRRKSLPAIVVTTEQRRTSKSDKKAEQETVGETHKSTTQASLDHAAVGAGHDLVWIARQNNLSLDMCREAAEVYCVHAKNIHESLDRSQFGHLMLRLADKKTLSEIPESTLEVSFKLVDSNGNGSIDFSEFVSWYSAYGFHVNFQVSDEEQAHRAFCVKNRMSITDLDRYRKYFSAFDSDGSGEIEEDEFEALLRKCARIPSDINIPPTRFRTLWNDADLDGSGAIDFQEFAIFYKKYFDEAGGMEGFYQSIRPALGLHGDEW
eukprot:TRINITY_DN14229_c0_g1_i1.p1 TRINITY_DN14229_c0_g1~~TRINITY_DN14229_c0_g1_i1.p1  ORF type:complete len:467 (+),score=88.71 TRINITY_DN14229_c0_g1_i1:74-1474(+)